MSLSIKNNYVLRKWNELAVRKKSDLSISLQLPSCELVNDRSQPGAIQQVKLVSF